VSEAGPCRGLLRGVVAAVDAEHGSVRVMVVVPVAQRSADFGGVDFIGIDDVDPAARGAADLRIDVLDGVAPELAPPIW
jgi:hypothetical protein